MDFSFFVIWFAIVLVGTITWNVVAGGRHRISPVVIAVLISVPIAYMFMGENAFFETLKVDFGLITPRGSALPDVMPDLNYEEPVKNESIEDQAIQYSDNRSVFDTSGLDTGDLLE